MELKLFFSEQEIISFLERSGYTVEDVDTWENESSYHNKVETVSYKVKIAFKSKDEIDGDLLLRDKYWIESKIGINTVFRSLIKEKILNL
jgi:hypothetical protein